MPCLPEVQKRTKVADGHWCCQCLQDFPWQHLVAGAAGGAISRTATAPLELLRLQAMTVAVEIQVDGGAAALTRRPSLLQALQAATGDQGWLGLWRGNGLNVLRAGPQKAIDFFAFELYKVTHGHVFT